MDIDWHITLHHCTKLILSMLFEALIVLHTIYINGFQLGTNAWLNQFDVIHHILFNRLHCTSFLYIPVLHGSAHMYLDGSVLCVILI